MAIVDFDALKKPLSDTDPCGPDLDMDFDDDYMNFVANLEGLLPTTFFVDGLPFNFDPAVINVDLQRTKCMELLQRTRDLRLLVLLARIFVLGRDLQAFAQTVDVMASLLGSHWDFVHPQAEGGRFAMRAAILGVLDEPTIVFSLQYCRVCETRRQGPVTFRSYLYAIREAEPREGEEAPAESTLIQAMRDSEAQVNESRAFLEQLKASLQRIEALWIEHADILSSPKLSNVMSIVTRMISFIDLAFPRETSALATTAAVLDNDRNAPGRPAQVSSASDAVRAIEAAVDYFRKREPSSPVLPLLVQGQQLLGKSFTEILQILLPDQVSNAAYQIGGRQSFQLPLERLPTFDTSGSTYDLTQFDEEAPAAELWPSEPAATEPAGAGHSEARMPEPSPARHFSAETRGQALTILDEVAAYLRMQEPGSPIPWLIERARALAERDFLSILRAILPPSALTDLDQNS
jgi:type VI secretion system protein ImpA